MSLTDYINALGDWIVTNIDKLIASLDEILFSVIVIIIGYIIYKGISREIRKLKDQKKLEEHVAFTMTRLVKWVFILIIMSAVLAQFGAALGVVSGLITLLGGTIIGFAAINTLGNAIAGFIVMTSRPFSVGDRIFFNEEYADVEGIELIYTKLRTLDNVLVSVPNQELLKAEIINFGKENIVRRQVRVTPGFEYNSREVEKVLLEAAETVSSVLKEPQPYVRITNFLNFAVEYTLYVFIDDIKRIREIDAELYKTVLETCKHHNIDLSTPSLIRSLGPEMPPSEP